MQETERLPKVRREKNFIVEENVDALRWPHECAVCGRAPETVDKIELKKKVKGLGEIKVSVDSIPYCQNCYAKVRASRRLDSAVTVISLVLGIPLGLILVVMLMADSDVRFIYLPCVFIPAIGVGYLVAWLLVKLPVKSLMRSRFADPVAANLIEEAKAEGKQGTSVAIEIPNPTYADKFAAMNL